VISILENASIRRQVAPLSVETYHALGGMGSLPENVELLRGMLVEKMSKSPLHSAVCQRLLRRLRAACEPALSIRQEQPLTLIDSEPEPDLAIVPASLDDYASGHPRSALLVIEVAISTEERDTAKAEIYAEAGVPEYWLILPATREVVIFRRPSPTGYGERLVVGAEGAVAAQGVPTVTVTMSELFG
jgi:Uma2 family endonuclease